MGEESKEYRASARARAMSHPQTKATKSTRGWGKTRSGLLLLALIPLPHAIVPNIHVLCSPPRAIAASDSEPLQQHNYVSGPRILCSARCCSATLNSRSPQSVNNASGKRICPLHRRPAYSLSLQACFAALHFLSPKESRRSV